MNKQISLVLILILIIIGVLFVIGCATQKAPFKPEIGNPEFREWCRSALSGEKSGDTQMLFKKAFNKDRISTEQLFQMALDYQLAGRMRAADEMWLTWTLETILYRQGDTLFANVLNMQSPQVQAAVRTFLSSQRIDINFSKTSKILDSAPNINFPLEQTYRNSD